MAENSNKTDQAETAKNAEAERRIEDARLQMGVQMLDLSDLGLTRLPESIERLSRLRRLDLSSNKLTALPESIGTLTHLQHIYLSANQLSMLPEAIGRLAHLQHLDLGGNQLTTLPESIGALSQLRVLDLTNGMLKSLPESIRKLSSLQELYLHEQPYLGLPPEILGPTWNEVHGLHHRSFPASPANILDYYFRLQRKGAARPLNEAKMILVGRGGVGKTSLVNRLVHGRYNPKETKTDGIFITPWPLQIHADDVKLNIWDFGGQEIMHSTHQFFLTKRSLYLLVLNAREGEQDTNVEYWLRLIESFGSDSPVIVVINKIADQVLDLNRRGLKEKFPSIRDFIQTDCESFIGLEELRAAILRETDRLEHLRDLFPVPWFKVKETLANLRQNEGKDFIRFSRYQALCAESGIAENVAQETLVSFLHDLGIVVNFRDDPRLAELHVLNPEWVTNGIYKILNAETLARKQGELHLVDLPRILDPKLYPRQMHLFLLDLMRKFELCYEYYEIAGRYLVPELLGKEEPDLSALVTEDALHFEYCYNILPEGLLPRLVVRSRVLNQDQPRWRTGVVLQWEYNTAVVKADMQDRRISIAVVGPLPGRRRLLGVIRADFEHIHASIPKLQARDQVPVPGHPGLAVEYETLRVMENEGEEEMKLVHNSRVVRVKVSDLLGGVDEERLRHISITTFRMPVRVVFSYSHKDEELRDQLETHLKLLQRQGFVSTWHDRKIMEGDSWKDVINDNFNQAELILLLVSADFIASDYCYEIEMKTALQRHSKHEVRVVPVILRACSWLTAPFGKLQGLPKDARPVTTWPDRDEAWNDVANGIRRTVEDLRQQRRA